MLHLEEDNDSHTAQQTNGAAFGDGVWTGFWRLLSHPTVSGTGALAASQYAGSGVNLLTFIAAARLLGPSSYGVAALIMAYPNLVRSLTSFKSASVTTRYLAGFVSTRKVSEFESMCKLGYVVDLLNAFVAFVVIALSAIWLTPLVVDRPGSTTIIVAYSSSFVFSSLRGTGTAVLTSLQEFRSLAGLQLFERIIQFVLVVGLMLGGFDVAGMVLGIALTQAIGGLLFMAFATWTSKNAGIGPWWSAPIGQLRRSWKELGSFFGWNYIVVSFGGLMAQGPLILLGWLRGPETAGYYRLASGLVLTASHIALALGRVAYPIFSGLWAKGEIGSLKKLFERWTLRGGLPIGLLLLLSIPTLPVLVPWTFGEIYQPMVVGLQFMMTGATMEAVFFAVRPLYYASGRARQYAQGVVVHTLFVLGLSWIFIQQWGFFGMAGLLAVGKILFVLAMTGLARSALWRRPNEQTTP